MSTALPKSICMLPWVSIETSPIGTTRPCCLAIEEITKDDGTKYDLNENNLTEIYRSEYMQQLRQQFRQGEKPTTCNRCWDEEAAGRTSKRQHSQIRLKHLINKVDYDNDIPDQLWFVDLKLGNICNLKCRICGSWSSSSWAVEEIAYIPGIDKKSHLAYTHLKKGMWPRNPDTKFWENMRDLIPNIQYMEFTGGEPFMIEEHFDLLRFAVETGHAGHIDIHYNTNATQWPDAENIWKEFRLVEFAFSIDNVGKRFEYERYGAKWDEVNANIDRFHALRDSSKKYWTQLCLTVNIQNVYYLDELCWWAAKKGFNDIYFNMLHEPSHMSIGNLTTQAKELVVQKLSQSEFNPKFRLEILKIIKFLENGKGSNGKIFLQKMQQTDSFRKQSFKDTHEEIAIAMGYV
jgi:MoaA/NifB/PqqE/SkfB family radical SAM enzyme